MRLVILFCFTLLPGNLIAGVVSRGTTVNLTGTTAATRPELAGVVVGDKILPFEIKSSAGEVILRGSYHSRVVRSNLTGELIFSGRIRDTSNPPGIAGWVTNARMEGFGFVDTDVDYRIDGSGTIPANRVIRSAVGDTLQFSIGNGLLNPPNESRSFFILTKAENFNAAGTVTLFGSNDFGGNSFQVVLSGVFVPEKPPLKVSLGKRLFFETQFYYPIAVTGAAQGLLLNVETSTTLRPESWVLQSEPDRTVTGAETTVFGVVTSAEDPRRFYRVTCKLPGP